MATVFIALGANLGDRLATLQSAVDALRELDADLAVSSVYETEPVGFLDQPLYLNAVARIETNLTPDEVLRELHLIENEHGRRRSFKNAPRTLDLDLLLYGDLIDPRPELTIPHPRMFERAFVLTPLLEIAPDLRDPVSGQPIAEIAGGLGPSGIAVAAGRLK